MQYYRTSTKLQPQADKRVTLKTTYSHAPTHPYSQPSKHVRSPDKHQPSVSTNVVCGAHSAVLHARRYCPTLGTSQCLGTSLASDVTIGSSQRIHRSIATPSWRGRSDGVLVLLDRCALRMRPDEVAEVLFLRGKMPRFVCRGVIGVFARCRC
jgi:hypothetical protein